jgi:hypothetical protein
MPRKAKDEINEISKEVKEKKTPATKTNKKTTSTKKVAEEVKKATKKVVRTTKTAKNTKTTTDTAKKKASSKTTTKKEAEDTKKKTRATKTTTSKATKEPVSKKTTKKTSTTSRKTKKTEKSNEILEDVNNNEVNEKVNIVEYYDLPYRYNQTVVKILAQTPNILFVYWYISDKDKNNFISKYGESFFNNTIPVLLVINKTMNYSYEVQINDFANSWYLHVNDADCEYQVELGRRNKEHPDYYYVTTSNNLDMPNDHILLEKIPNNVLFKNVKTQELVEKPVTSISFFKDFAKSKEFYKYFKELLNNELEGDGINLNLPSSHTSSSFK